MVGSSGQSPDRIANSSTSSRSDGARMARAIEHWLEHSQVGKVCRCSSLHYVFV